MPHFNNATNDANKLLIPVEPGSIHRSV